MLVGTAGVRRMLASVTGCLTLLTLSGSLKSQFHTLDGIVQMIAPN